MACRSGCDTQDHATFGECARAAHIRTMYLGGTTSSFTEEKRFRKTNEDFRNAVKAGLQPAGVSDRAIRQAVETAEKG